MSDAQLAKRMFDYLVTIAEQRYKIRMAKSNIRWAMAKVRKLKKTGKFGRFTVGRTKRTKIEVQAYWRKGYTYVFEGKDQK